MINKKTLLLGSAAALLVTGVQAADMPKAPAREPVYRCDITGFIELPGTNVCFKVGGFARFYAAGAEDNVGGEGHVLSWSNVGPNGTHTRNDTFVMNAQARLNFDARTATELGTIRTYVEMQADDGNSSTSGPFNLRHAFIQVGNWTFGKTWALLGHGDSAPEATWYVGAGFIGDPYGRVVQVRYTMPLGNGMSLAVALEDPKFGQAGDYAYNWLSQTTGTTGVVAPFGAQERDEVPAVTAALSFSGDWGSAQIGGGIRQNVYAERATAASGSGALTGAWNGVSDRDVGWRVDAGVAFNLSEMILLTARGYYASGYNAHSSIALGDIVWDAGLNVIGDDVDEWMVMGGIHVRWTPTVRSTLAVAYAEASTGGTLGGASVPGGLVAPIAGFYDVQVLQVLANVFWSPVPRLNIGFEVSYIDVDYTTPLGLVCTLSCDGDAFAAAFEVTRSW